MPLSKILPVSRLLALPIMLCFAAEAFAQREDRQFASQLLSDEALGASDGGIFGTFLIVAFGIFVIFAFILDKYFRFFVFAFAGMIVGLIAIFDTFDKQGRVVAILVVMAALFYADRQLRK